MSTWGKYLSLYFLVGIQDKSFFSFRMYFAEGVGIFPQFAPFNDKDGKLYASKEKLYVQLNGFMIPKSSPLKASKVANRSYTCL